MKISLDLVSDRQRRDAVRSKWRQAGWYGQAGVAQTIRASVERHHDNIIFFARADGGADAVGIGALHEEGLALAGSLRAVGVEPGTSLLIQAPADRSGSSALIAGWALGACVIPVPVTTSADEIGHIVAETSATTLLASSEWRGMTLAGALAARCEELGLNRVIALGSDLPKADLGHIEPPLTTEPALILYTSGSTAKPKGVVHSHETLLFGLDLAPPDPTSRTLASFPAGHVASLYGVMRPLITGDYTVILDRWSARRAVELIHEHRISASAGTPFFLQTLLDEADRAGTDISSLKQFLCGAAAVPPALVARAERQGILTWRTYGSTEHPAISSGLPEDPLDKRLRTDGRVVAVNEVRVVDPSGTDLPDGVDGEIVSRGPKQFLGYQDARLDHEAFLDGTWFRTGDTGHFDEDRYLVITGRLKDIIIRGGENISAREIEEVLLAHPGVDDVAVCAGTDPMYGEVPVAVIVGSPDLESVISWCRDAGLATHKLPARVLHVDQLPRNPSGKILKRDLVGLLGT